MADYLLDTSLLIDLLRDDPRADSYLVNLPDDTGLCTHAIVQAELLVGLRSAKDLGRLDRLLRRLEVLHPNVEDSVAALSWLRKLHFSHKIGVSDCLIAATAIRLGLPVVTINARHFRLFTGLKVIRPY